MRLGHANAVEKRKIVYIPRLVIEKIQSEGRIGAGSFGQVFQVKFENEHAAIKQVSVGEFKAHPHKIQLERDMIIYLKSERIVNLIGCFYVRNNTYFLQELCIGKNF